MAGVPGGVEITTVADIPSRGTGLGSSSSFTVSLLHALYAFVGRHSTRQELAEQACHIEIDVCGEPIGKQDQYAAAYGGFNLYEFNPNDTVTVSPVICKPTTIAGSGNRCWFFTLGSRETPRQSSSSNRRSSQSTSIKPQ